MIDEKKKRRLKHINKSFNDLLFSVLVKLESDTDTVDDYREAIKELNYLNKTRKEILSGK